MAAKVSETVEEKKKAPAKKAATKKTAAKKTTVKKTAKEKKPASMSDEELFQKAKDVINWKKGEAHALNWLYIEVNDKALAQELGIKDEKLRIIDLAMLAVMLEGDGLTEQKGFEITIKYYVDNLADSRKKAF